MPEPNKTLTNLIADRVETAALAGLATLNGAITDTEISSLTGGNLAVDASGNLSVESGTFLQATIVASGAVALSGNTATVATGVTTSGATILVALGVQDPNANTKVAARAFWDDTAGEHKVEIVEDGTNVGNPTVSYDIIRVS